jgi:aryl sulfotransferase
MNRIANDTTQRDAQGSSILQHASLQEAYETLRDVRDALARGKKSQLSDTDPHDGQEDRLLLLCAMNAIEALAVRGYLELRGNSNDPRQAAVVFTEQGHAALREARASVYKDPWAEFQFRPGDIVISAVPKSGITWVQMICALLIFQTAELPAPISNLSPWLGSPSREQRARSERELAAQEHRRFIKSHKALNQIPADPQVTYIVVARNPLDVAVSQNYQDSVLLTANSPGQRGGSERPPKSAHERLIGWIDQMGQEGRDSYFDRMLRSLSHAWERRDEPNVVLVHYEDLSADLPGEMHRLASRLDITVPADKWPSLVEAATFKQMRAAADQLQPLKYAEARDASKGHAAFFRRGSSGEGRSLLTEAEAARYYALASRVAPRDLLAWLHREDERHPILD